MSTNDLPHQCADIIKQKIGSLAPRIAIILGSGLGSVLLDSLKNYQEIFYHELPGFPHLTIPGHEGRLLIGNLNQVPILCLQGRAHLYEGTKAEVIKTQIRTLKLLGIENLIVTNAAGGLDPRIRVGSLILIKDHMNFQGSNPLIGPNDEEYGPRFIAMRDIYSPKLRCLFHQTAAKINLTLTEGVYLGVTGPCFETPAEVTAFQRLGASMVGMSTVSEVIIAHHCGLHIAGISAITNACEGLSDEILCHEHTLLNASQAASHLTPLLFNLMEHFR